ncbi:unnamed protein product [Amoebophrya sp. A120]|nr:unnamed protein product [Amoebophrya sp. A120]|eukprot:GSA120T00017593001.1
MPSFRFDVGTQVLCNLGQSGWKMGKVIALNYREDAWPPGQKAPYQVALEGEDGEFRLIYVPVDDDYCCRKPTDEDLKIANRADALAALPNETATKKQANNKNDVGTITTKNELGSTAVSVSDHVGYRAGLCHCCQPHPQSWSCVELYSEHYRGATRNDLKVTRRSIDLGSKKVGAEIECCSSKEVDLLSKSGFMQRPTLVRLPPGVRFADDGSLKGKIRFDPHRESSYKVEFVAVSAVDWKDPKIGLVRLEITFTVTDNDEPLGFDPDEFAAKQQEASAAAAGIYQKLCQTWDRWERSELDQRDTCDLMCAHLARLRDLLEEHPRLEDGLWWAQLGGFYMNVHKLLENTLFECELYLGYALTFGSVSVRQIAEQNLEGCYQKRLLESARFLWIDGVKQMMHNDFRGAIETFQKATAKKDGWGWAVNVGDIWIFEAAARLILTAEGNEKLSTQVDKLLEKHRARCKKTGTFKSSVHPWAAEVTSGLSAYRNLQSKKSKSSSDTTSSDSAGWLEGFKKRTLFWCAQVLGGVAPFPPKPRPRLEDAQVLVDRLPGHNVVYERS